MGGLRLARSTCAACVGAAVVLSAIAPGSAVAPESAGASAAGTGGPNARFALANGCYGLRSRALGRFIAKAPGGVYRAGGGSAGAERFRLKATDLGLYLLYGPSADFFAVSSGPKFSPARRASPSTEWEVRVGGGAFRLQSRSTGKVLSATRSGALTLVDVAIADRGAAFDFERLGGCIDFPEIGAGARGAPARGETPYGEVGGFLDAHVHVTGFQLFGGRARCGRPWHRYGVEHALVDCPDHYPNGAGAGLETGLGGSATHDPIGWATFRDWPRPESLTHEQTYYKWIERAWKAGLRVMVSDVVENGVLCDAYPLKRDSCDEMESARRQIRFLDELERYIDAQSGGPGKGWMRIVRSPSEARRVINDGKLALVIGLEISRPFGCRIYNGRPQCDTAKIDRELDDLHRRGVRSLFPIHKFDNALGGVRFDGGTTGVAVNAGNRIETGRYWRAETCKGKETDNEQLTHNDVIGSGLNAFLPSGTTPTYPRPPHCNPKGLTKLGEHVIRRMVEKKMIIEPDHMSVQARNQTLSMLEARKYSGVIASHNWSDPLSFPRYLALGGLVTAINAKSPDFIAEWRRVRRVKSKRRVFGFGYGADSNGLHSQPGARGGGVPNPVRYPFKSFDGKVTFDRQRSGKRVWDVNTDGVAQYGLHADWIEDLRLVGGRQIVTDMFRGAEAYLQMWERAEGVPEERCRGARARFTRRGLGRQRLRVGPESLLRHGGQPASRAGRVWRYCVRGTGTRRRVVGVFTRRARVGLVASTARGHKAFGIGRGSSARRLRGKTRRFGRGIRVRRAGRRSRIVYGVHRGRVRFVAVADRSVLTSKRRLRHYLTLARLRRPL